MSRFLIAVILAFPVFAFAQAPGQDDGKYIVTFREGTSQAQRAAAVQRAAGELRFNYSIVNAVAIRITNPNTLAALQRDPSVLSIVPDRKVSAFQESNGVGANAKPGGGGSSSGQVIPSGVQRVGLPASGNDGSGVGVAIVDTGIDLLHADLAPGAGSFSAFGSSCQDDNSHGTHVAGIVAALDNSTGVIGVAPAARPYCVKVLDGSGSGSDSDVMAGLNWVAQNANVVAPPIRVVNMSLGRPGSLGDNPSLRTAVQVLYNAGITVVVAAGNDPSVEVKDTVPATYPEVLAVASTTAVDGSNSCRWFSGVIKADTASYFTTDGKLEADNIGVTISAPGADKENISRGCLISSVGILSTKLGGGTTRLSGTSMASPHVAGIAARMIQRNVAWVPEGIRSALRVTAQNPGTAPLDSPTSSYTFDNEREGVAKAP